VPVPEVELRPVPAPVLVLVLPVVPAPAAELAPVVPAAELTALGAELVRAVEPVLLDELLSPEEVLVLPVEEPLTPEHGATVGEVALVLLGEMVTPATLQFSGICCSMSST